jgi:hypothetical protein
VTWHVNDLLIKEVCEMDPMEKAKKRLEHWMGHNDQHCEEYEKFAQELEKDGHLESAAFVREIVPLTERATELMRKALEAL